MEKTLEIIITHYNEEDSICAPLIDSIAIQQCINWCDVGIIVVEDGGEKPMSDNVLSRLKGVCDVRHIFADHAGVSHTRNLGLSKATAEYVMFCDCDDMFSSVFGICYIFNEINKGEFDELNPDFTEEVHQKDGKRGFHTHHEDLTFIHGKVYRRAWLVRNHIGFPEGINHHEDGAFNALVHHIAGAGVRVTKQNFYLWKYRENSVCRRDLFVLKTFKDLLASRTYLVSEFEKRGMQNQAALYAAMLILDSYFFYNTPTWQDPVNKELVKDAMGAVKIFWKLHRALCDSVPRDTLQTVVPYARQRAVAEGLVSESITLNEWLKLLS